MRSLAVRLVALLAAASALVLAGAGTAGAVPLAGPTAVKVVQPFGPLGLYSSYHAVGNVRGTCFTGSLADQHRRNAWRCMSGNAILDPCFESPAESDGFLACFSAPWSSRVIGLHLTKPLPEAAANKGRPPQGYPWGVQLASGTRCTFETGASGIVDGRRINYGCRGGGALVGSVDRSARTWTVLYQAEAGAGPLVRRPIAIAWY